jgi:hypothetical protein
MPIATLSVPALRRPIESTLAATVTVMNEAAAMQRLAIVQSLLESIENEAGMRRS